MKKKVIIFVLFVLIMIIISCTYKTCPTYTDNDRNSNRGRVTILDR